MDKFTKFFSITLPLIAWGCMALLGLYAVLVGAYWHLPLLIGSVLLFLAHLSEKNDDERTIGRD